MTPSFDGIRRVADVVLYEGYVLYPYRADARKNLMRWQFGVLAPRGWSEADGSESSWIQTDCLIEPGAGKARLTGVVRGLQLQHRSVEVVVDAEQGRFRRVDQLDVDGQLWTSWDEGIEREIELAVPLVAGAERRFRFAFVPGYQAEPLRDRAGQVVGRVVRELKEVVGEIHVRVQRAAEAFHPVLRVQVRVDNLSRDPRPGAPRDEALRSSLVGVHTLLAVEGGAFLSLIDPPEWAHAAVTACDNVRTWPVLAGAEGDRDLLMAAPIILYDHPQVAADSPGDLYDATEIDEILTLRTMTLTDDEKRAARAADPRAAAIIDRVDALSAEALSRLHGTIRSPSAAPPEAAPWWDPGADGEVSPETDAIDVDGVAVARGSLVVLRPGRRRADAQDMFLQGRVATVEAVFEDVDGQRYLAVTLVDDPAADLHAQHGRFLYFAPDEVEPLDAISGAHGAARGGAP